MTAYFEGVDSFWNYCWSDTSPEPYWVPLDVTTGLKKSISPSGRSWRTCQYFFKGLSPVCSYFRISEEDADAKVTSSGSYGCFYEIDSGDESNIYPSGYNGGRCDFLGRRSWCDKYYAGGEDNPDEYICVAPNPYITGLGKKSSSGDGIVIAHLPRKSILGYNDDGEGVGKCDCYGMGRGAAGCGIISDNALITETNLSKLPLVCNFYKPYQMGFGALEPHPVKRDKNGKITEGAIEDAYKLIGSDPSYRLPLNYKLYNLRAKFMKCHWWNKDEGSNFKLYNDQIILEEEEIGEPFTPEGRITFCTCEDSMAIPFNTRYSAILGEDYNPNYYFTGNVWARGGGPICNGARPECPCYSGKWIYLIEEKMMSGMPVTANQIFELRFWMADWESQRQYDDFFNLRPNFDDPRSPAIYTFNTWKKLGQTAMDSIAEGKKLSMCQPAPLSKEFIPSFYIKIESPVTYKAAYVESGTTSSTERAFPTLIRDFIFQDIKPLTIVYPYLDDETVFSNTVCLSIDDSGQHVKKHNKIEGDRISIIGNTIRNKKVYVFNTNKIPVDDLIEARTSMFSSSHGERMQITEKLISVIDDGFKDEPDYIIETTSDSLGVFIASSIKLITKETNKILICVDFENGMWEFRWRRVESKWCGGVIVQTRYKFEYGNNSAGYINYQPKQIIPKATVDFKLIPLGGCKTTKALSSYSFLAETLTDSRVYYSYSIIKNTVVDYTEGEDEQGKEKLNWSIIGNSNLIWAVIQDKNLNYIYPWKILDGTRLEPKNTGTKEKVGTVYLEQVNIDISTIPPNACILRPIDSDVRIKFFNSDWQLFITFEYQEMVNKKVTTSDTVSIMYGGGSESTRIYVPSPYELISQTVEGRSYVTINKFSRGPIGVMAYFFDEDERLISTMATKALTNIIRETCRNVEIFYSYYTTGRKYQLNPFRGICVDIRNDTPMDRVNGRTSEKHVEIPNCGDHEMSVWHWEGPMWFPYNACRGYDMYDEWTVCNFCTAGYTGPRNEGYIGVQQVTLDVTSTEVEFRRDFRYCGPYKYYAYGEVRGNWLQLCDCGCSFSYSDASSTDVAFNGYCNIRTFIPPGMFTSDFGAPPPFGNDGRDAVDSFMSQDYIYHKTNNRYEIEYRAEWMPIVFDNSNFAMTFNSFDDVIDTTEDYSYVAEYSLDPFYVTNQLNFMISMDIYETIDSSSSRYRFDDLFEVHFEGNCSYPLPIIYFSESNSRVVFYYFKFPDVAWAWQEYWKDIERNLDPDPDGIKIGKLDFIINFKKPKYIYSLYKEEHRLICDEGKHDIIYKCPEIKDEDGKRIVDEYPTLSLDGNKPRSFEIIYDKYDDSAIEWMDDGGNAKVGASSKNDNIYEKAMGGDWLHDENILFDKDAVTTKEAAKQNKREVVVDMLVYYSEVKKYYNRGIIPNITRERLCYLPKDETELCFNGSSFGDINISCPEYYTYGYTGFSWVGDDISLVAVSCDVAISKIKVEGYYGYRRVSKDSGESVDCYVKPSLSIIAIFRDDSIGIMNGFSNSTAAEYPIENQDMIPYSIVMNFRLTPVNMITNKIKSFIIKFRGPGGNNCIGIESIKLYTAEYSSGKTEHIKTWERKYITSKYYDGNTTRSLDYSEHDCLSYDLHDYKSGVYFPLSQKDVDLEIVARDKMRSICCGKYYDEDEKVQISYSTLHDIEANKQKDIYENAIRMNKKNFLVYFWDMPEKFKTFFSDMSITFNMELCWFYFEKLEWEKHATVKLFKQYEYWRPGGHYYTWDQRATKQKCTLKDTPRASYLGKYVHVDHTGTSLAWYPDASFPVDPRDVYYSFRTYVCLAKYYRVMMLSGGISPATGPADEVASANLYNTL